MSTFSDHLAEMLQKLQSTFRISNKQMDAMFPILAPSFKWMRNTGYKPDRLADDREDDVFAVLRPMERILDMGLAKTDARIDEDYHPNLRALATIMGERMYQRRKWGTGGLRPGEYLTILRKLMNDADRAFAVNSRDEAALSEIRQIAAVALAAIEDHANTPERELPVAIIKAD